MADFSKELEVRTLKLNRVILFLTMSDVCTWGPYLIITTLGGIYLAQKLGENAVEIIGIGASVYFITRALLQLPVGLLTDRIRRDRDEIIVLSIGNALMGLPFVLYPYVNSAPFYFFLQFIFGVGTAMNLVNWRKLFAKNLDRGKEGVEYGFYEMILSLSTAALTAIGGFVANSGKEYFDWVMRVAGLIMMSASLWASQIYLIKNRRSKRLNA